MATDPRGVDGIALLRELLPGAAVDALWLLTWLGSVAVVTGLVAAVYWFESRERGAWALGAILGAYALIIAVKAAFGLPRPPEPLWRIAADGFGFPSGHATAATVGWGALALAVDRGTRRQRFGVAAAVVAVVALSRVALGVHYVVDVLAGIAVGTAFLWGVHRLGSPGRAFGLAAGLALAAVGVTGGGEDAVLLLGVAVGALLVWTRWRVPPAPIRRDALAPTVGGLVAVGAIGLVAYRIDVVGPLAVVTGAVAGAAVVGLPIVVDRLGG